MSTCISNSPADMLANTLLSETSSGLWIVSASSGMGKTTFCGGYVARARQAGLSVGGILCPAVYGRGEEDWYRPARHCSGERRRLGLRTCNKARPPLAVGKWMRACLPGGTKFWQDFTDEEIIVIDELGPLELEEGHGYQEALRLLDEGTLLRCCCCGAPSLAVPGANSLATGTNLFLGRGG